MVDCESTKPEPSTHGIRHRAKRTSSRACKQGVKHELNSRPSSSLTEMEPQGCHALTDTSGNTKRTGVPARVCPEVPGSESSSVYDSPTVKDTMEIGGIDILETTWVDRRTAAFCAWRKEAKLNPKNMLLDIPGGKFRRADLEWFEVLYKARGHLSNLHIDALMNLAIIRFDKHDPNAARSWIVFDQNTSNALLAKDFTIEAFLKCNSLANSRFPPPPLRKISRLFGVANVQSNHWVLYMLTMAEKKITVYDSLNLESHVLEDHFLPLSSNIQELFAFAEDNAGRHGSGWCDFPPWHVEICQDLPRQTNLHDCGILVVKFLECLVHGIRLMRLDAGRCHIYRRSFCAQLYDFSTQNA